MQHLQNARSNIRRPPIPDRNLRDNEILHNVGYHDLFNRIVDMPTASYELGSFGPQGTLWK